MRTASNFLKLNQALVFACGLALAMMPALASLKANIARAGLAERS